MGFLPAWLSTWLAVSLTFLPLPLASAELELTFSICSSGPSPSPFVSLEQLVVVKLDSPSSPPQLSSTRTS